jgi:hydrogenase maturation factor
MCLAVPVKLLIIYDSASGMRMCKIDFGRRFSGSLFTGITRSKVGDFTIRCTLVFALNILSEKEAMETLDALRELVKSKVKWMPEKLCDL